MQTISLNEEFKNGLYTYSYIDLEQVLHLLLRGFVASYPITNYTEHEREEIIGKIEAVLVTLEKIETYAQQSKRAS